MATRHKIAYADKTFTDQTAGRALDTTYTNADVNSSMLVLLTIRCAVTVAGGAAWAIAKSDTATPPTVAVSGNVGIEAGLLNEDGTFQLVFVVGPGKTYKVITTQTNGTVTKQFWGELLF